MTLQTLNNLLCCSIALLSIAATQSTIAAPGDILETGTDRRGGQTEKLEWLDTAKEYITIHYPKDFTPEKTYHLLFWFHGTSGSPTASIGVAHSQYITVGMSYLKKDRISPGKYAEAHWQTCQSIRSSIQSRRQLKLGRNLAGGVSKGGWMAFYLGNANLPNLDGIIIVAAGKDPNTHNSPDLSTRKLSVLVATGETDPNFPQAQLAVDYFRKANAVDVTYEEWPGKGHIVGLSPRVVHWLDVEAHRDTLPAAALEARYTPILIDEIEKILALENTKDQYIGLRHLIGDPRFDFASESVRNRLKQSGSLLRDKSELGPWLEAQKEYQTLVTREASFFNDRSFEVPAITKLVEHYHRIATNSDFPDIAARAANSYMRAAKMKAIYEAQVKARDTPEFQLLALRYAELQKLFSDTRGNPGEAVMKELNQIGGELSRLRSKSSMDAFREVEWRDQVDRDGVIDAIIKKDRTNQHPWKIYSGTSF